MACFGEWWLRGDFRCFCGLVGFRFGVLVRNNFVGFVGFCVGIALWFGWLFWVICCFGLRGIHAFVVILCRLLCLVSSAFR